MLGNYLQQTTFFRCIFLGALRVKGLNFFFLQDLEKFIRESRAAASHLDTAEMELQHRYRVKGPESPTSPVEALRQHQFFQDSTLSVPRQVIRDGNYLLISPLKT